MSDEKKEKVLHTRVSESLEDELKQRANQLGVSVSNLVRNVLHNAFEMVEDIVSDTSRVASAAKGSARRGIDLHGAVSRVAWPVGWQELVLNVNAVCNQCNDILARGARGAVAIYQSGKGPRVFLCERCLANLHNPPDQEEQDDDGDETAD